MAYIPRDGYMHDLNGEQLVDFLAEEKRESNFGKELVLYGVGNHGGGPTMAMLERAKRAQSVPAFPKFKLVASNDFFDALSTKEQEQLPIWNSELYLERFRGCYTSQAHTKKHNRKGQVLIKTAEKTAAIASLYGYEYPRENIFKVWRTVLFNQFHDILPGTSINAVYKDTERQYSEAEKLAHIIINRSLEHLAQQIDTRGPGDALILFNPLSWRRTSPVEIALDDLEMNKEWTILDEQGKSIPVQMIDKNATGANLLFLARDLPSYGYKVYRLINSRGSTQSNSLSYSDTSLENEYLRIDIDQNSGLISEIIAKEAGSQILSQPRGNLLQILPDDANDAWNVRFSRPAIDLDRAREVTFVEAGPVRTTIKVVHAFSGTKKRVPTEDFPSSFFTQYISLYDGVPYMEVNNEIMWWEDHKVLKVAFPININANTANYEIPYGSIKRPTGFETPFEKARYEVPAQRWADLSGGSVGVSLINDCKHGYDIKGNIMRLTLLRAPTDPDPLADRGYHTFKYALYPHEGDFSYGQVVQRGYEFNEPIKVFRTESHLGSLPVSFSFIQVEPKSVVLNVFKKSEEGHEGLLRVYETAGEAATVTIRTVPDIHEVREVNLIEDIIRKIESDESGFSFQILPNEIRSFRVKLK
jgi:alpha-mannosidase